MRGLYLGADGVAGMLEALPAGGVHVSCSTVGPSRVAGVDLISYDINRERAPPSYEYVCGVVVVMRGAPCLGSSPCVRTNSAN